MDYTSIVIALLAAVFSGMGTAIIAGLKESKKEKRRQAEREQDHLKLEIKDLKIALYQLEKELTDWKDKYYDSIQELIQVKSELENALVQLNIIELRDVDSEY
jgi:septal ring factor EnvC (AmiA/AmiB activator)